MARIKGPNGVVLSVDDFTAASLVGSPSGDYAYADEPKAEPKPKPKPAPKK